MITVNGEKVDSDTTLLSDLLSQMNLSKELCAVEVNKKLIPHKERDEYILQDGDDIEVVTLVGGG
ncbi:MAG: sulfur carrier protein ThiS [Phycisphaerales bacterium]|nr:sulfur carrier protein ThiS [Phycisphaerales bacterium]